MRNRLEQLPSIIIFIILILIGVGINKTYGVPEDLKTTPQEIKIETTMTTTTTSTTTTTKKTTKRRTTKKVVKVNYSKSELQQYAYELVIARGWSEEDYNSLVKLIQRESGWNPNAVNKSSGACGLGQAYPCSKMKSHGSDYRTNGRTQLRWTLDYIKNRYGTPTKAWNFWQKKHWY